MHYYLDQRSSNRMNLIRRIIKAKENQKRVEAITQDMHTARLGILLEARNIQRVNRLVKKIERISGRRLALPEQKAAEIRLKELGLAMRLAEGSSSGSLPLSATRAATAARLRLPALP